MLRESFSHGRRWSFGLRSYLISKDLGMDLRALYKVDKVTNEQGKKKSSPERLCLLPIS